MITLYDKPECPFCYRVRLSLAYLGLPWQRLPHDDPEIEKQWRSLTHAKTVPVLVHEGIVLTDSTIILEYLQDRFGGLLPDDPVKRAAVREWLRYADNPVGRAVRVVVFQNRDEPEPDEDKIRAAEEKWLDSLPALDRAIGDNEWFVDGFSYADAALLARFGLAMGYGWSIPEQHVDLRRWFDDKVQRDFFREASPPVVLRWLESR